jgi:hypothetical protein
MIGVASWDTSSLSPGLYSSKSAFQAQKEQPHEIYQIFRPTTCTVVGVASWEPSSLSLRSALLKQFCLSSVKRGCLMRFLEYLVLAPLIFAP